MKRIVVALLFALLAFARADHVPPVGLDYSGTWVVLIAVGTIMAMLILSILWAYLDGQFDNPEQIKHKFTKPEAGMFVRGTSIERPVKEA